jgi:hypothetical protein
MTVINIRSSVLDQTRKSEICGDLDTAAGEMGLWLAAKFCDLRISRHNSPNKKSLFSRSVHNGSSETQTTLGGETWSA